MRISFLEEVVGVTRRIHKLAVALVLVFGGTFLLAACSPQTPVEPIEPPVEEQTAPGVEEDALYTPEYQPTGSETAVITTNKGEIVVELYGEDAPIHVGNFVELVQQGFYDDTKFHRYEPGFVIQGGDPQTREFTSEEVADQAGQPGSRLGTGGPGYQIPGEFDPEQNPNTHIEGALGMARSQSPDSAGSQFYFTLAETPFLDGQYTVFGRVTSGFDVVQELRAGDVIESVEVRGAANQ